MSQSRVEAEVGTDAHVQFTISSPPKSGHSLIKEGSDTIKAEYEIKEDRVIFKDVSLEDAGDYKLSCTNKGKEGSSRFELAVIVTPPPPPPEGEFPSLQNKILFVYIFF